MAKVFHSNHIKCGGPTKGNWETFSAEDDYSGYPYPNEAVTKFKSKDKLLAELKKSRFTKHKLYKVVTRTTRIF